MPPFLALIGGSARSQSPITDAERSVNWSVELSDTPGAASPASLYPTTPGVDRFGASTAVGCRGDFTDDKTGRVFVVMGARFQEVDAAGVTTDRGMVAVDGNPATISTNGDGGGQLLITSGDKGYCFDLNTNTFSEVISSGATQGGLLYGFGLVFDKATGTVKISDLLDLTAWDPTQFFARSIGTDPWQAMYVTPYGYIVLPGTQTGETWYNAGTFPIPFAPDPSGQFARGCAATFSGQLVGDTLCWLSTGSDGDYTVVRQSGFTPNRISTHPVEDKIAGYAAAGSVSDAIGQVYADRGHLYYLLTFLKANATWVYDAVLAGKANPWHERGTWISEDNRYIYWRPVFHCVAFGKHLMGDPDSNLLYVLNPDSSTDVDGRPIRRLRVSPPLISEHKRIILDALELLFETGLGTAAGQGSDPQVMLRVSRDGGQTFGNERRLSAGKQGEYWRRVVFRLLGMARSFVFEISVSDPVPWRLTAAYVRVRPTTESQAA